ncbi:RNA polymerase sigma factor [Azospirillum picis]|uniref:RNA polymerase sigma-70 factor (ECF subfamily) n=1 Tax=Azospirillum picis TaxID=488438 RepID=A0ABU0MTA6_9PROT|nr:sigma-70 family RNA polymerase sigma factor [Azospirillum picis]MBP2302935.1 RNA polymerase sigma-70 factor (ECF subfamily) [Azospirillum picis]MDQ0536687.1 RNA polymerase sigma-70 factor (ECF subfamily) [Azospirillum picis]
MTGPVGTWARKIAELFDTHRLRVERAIARRTGDPQTAGDLAQDAFLRLARLPDGEAVQNPAGLLFVVADRIALDHCRAATRQRLREAGPPDETLPAAGPGADAVIERSQTFARLRGAIDALPPKTRDVFLLYHVEGLRYRAIGERLGISPRTVEYHLRTALEQCRAHMMRRPPR